MNRTDVRYALYRVKCGNSDQAHEDVWNKYKQEVAEMGYTINEFNEDWDIAKGDSLEVIGRRLTQRLIAENTSSSEGA